MKKQTGLYIAMICVTILGIIIVDPVEVRERMRGMLLYTVKNYDELSR